MKNAVLKLCDALTHLTAVSTIPHGEKATVSDLLSEAREELSLYDEPAAPAPKSPQQ